MKTNLILAVGIVFLLFPFSVPGATVTSLQVEFGRPPVNGTSIQVKVRPAKGYGLVQQGLAEDTGEFYRANHRKIGLFRSLERFSVRTGDTGAGGEQRMRRAKSENPSDLENDIPGRGAKILKSRSVMTHNKLASLVRQGLADPVYINSETGQPVVLTDRFVVRLSESAGTTLLDDLKIRYGLEIISPMHGSDREFICRKADITAPALLDLCESLLAEPGIEWTGPDFLFNITLHYTPADPLFANQWHLHNTGQLGGVVDADIDGPEVWDRTDLPRGGSPDITVAVIDTGVDIDHPDLAANTYTNLAEYYGTSKKDDDGNGYKDDIHGWDFYGNDNDPNPTNQAHGTCCAGLVAACEGNGLGGVGVAFGCKVLPVKICSDSGLFASSTAIGNGIRYGANMANVLTNSWGGGGDDSIIHSAIQYAVNTKGRPVFFASGNYAGGYSVPGWIQYTLSGFPAGTFIFKWEYAKNASYSDGDDTVWVDDVTFPGGAFEGFEGSTFPPTGWVTGGSAAWAAYSESIHVRGTGARSAKAGAITHSQTTYLQTVRTVGAGNLVFYAWVSSEDSADYFNLYVNGTNYFSNSGVPDPEYDVMYPACYSECIAVGAATDCNFRSDYSEFDYSLSNVLDLTGPSNGGFADITTTDIAGSYGYSSGDYTSDFGGTSAATPITAGVAALVLSKTPTLTPAQVLEVLEQSADMIGAGQYTDHYNPYYGYGRVNAYAAVAPTSASPTIIVQPENQIALPGGTAEFSVTADGVDLSYQWQKRNDSGGWDNVSGATGETYTLDPVAASDAGNYQCVVSNSYGTVTSNIVWLNGGDANRDGQVNLEDLSLLGGNYGESGKAWSTGDFSGDGTVDLTDLSILAGNYGLGG